MYIKSTYDGLHVITGTTEGVSQTSYWLFLNSDLHVGFHWDDPELSPLQCFLAAELMLAGLLVDTDTKRSITADQFTALLLLSVFCV